MKKIFIFYPPAGAVLTSSGYTKTGAASQRCKNHKKAVCTFSYTRSCFLSNDYAFYYAFFFWNRRAKALITSERTMTEKARANSLPHMAIPRGTVPKNAPANWMISTCSTKVQPTTNSISLFLNRWQKILSLCSSGS